MAYSDFTIPQLKQLFGLHLIEDRPLFTTLPEYPLPAHLADTLKRYLPLALNMNTEKARSELLIAPLLTEFKLSELLIAPLLTEFKLLHHDAISLFSGVEFNVDDSKGLRGRCDYLICHNPEQLAITAPVCVAVEAKNDNITGGIAQCLAEMVAAAMFNQQQQIEVKTIYGIVTTGMSWRFLALEGQTAIIDITEYSIQTPQIIFGLLRQMFALSPPAQP